MLRVPQHMSANHWMNRGSTSGSVQRRPIRVHYLSRFIDRDRPQTPDPDLSTRNKEQSHDQSTHRP